MEMDVWSFVDVDASIEREREREDTIVYRWPLIAVNDELFYAVTWRRGRRSFFFFFFYPFLFSFFLFPFVYSFISRRFIDSGREPTGRLTANNLLALPRLYPQRTFV